MSDCGGCRWRAGDLIVADGVALVPQARTAEVCQRAEAVMAMKEAFTRGFQRGESVKVLVGLKQQHAAARRGDHGEGESAKVLVGLKQQLFRPS